MKIPKWQHELARYYKRGKLVSYFLNNAAKTCLYGLEISENIEIGHVFQSRAFFHLSSNLHTSCLSAFSSLDFNEQISVFIETIMNIMSNFLPNELVTCDDQNPPWVNRYIKNLIVAINNFHEKFVCLPVILAIF